MMDVKLMKAAIVDAANQMIDKSDWIANEVIANKVCGVNFDLSFYEDAFPTLKMTIDYVPYGKNCEEYYKND